MLGRRRRVFHWAGVVVIVLAWFAGTGWVAAKPAAKPDLSSVSTEDLIARFQEVSEEGIDADIIHIGSEGFVMLGWPVRLGTGLLADPALAILRELSRRGAAAVPALLDHLSDARPTGMRVISHESSSPIIWRYGTGYSPRHPGSTDLPPGVTRMGSPSKDIDRSDSYQFVVGDLCFVTLGEIVNRDLSASYRDVGENYLVINSPVHSPALAAAARADWSGLTAEGLKQSLVEDAQRVTDDPPTDSLQRLLFYYPDDGRALAVQLLQRPVSDFEAPGFSMSTLLATDDEKEQDRLLAEFRGKYGAEAYRLLTQSLILTANETPNLSHTDELDREEAQQRGNAKKIVARHFAAMNQHPRAVEITADCKAQRAIVETVEAYPSYEINQSARGLIKRTLALNPTDPSDKLEQCWLVSACMQRLLPPTLRQTISKDVDRANVMLPTDAKTKRAFMRGCDRFLRKWAKKLPPG